MIRQLFNLVSFALAGLFLLVAVAVAQLWPASYWLDVRSVHIADTVEGQPILMVVDRDIKRNFIGEWLVSVRKIDANGAGLFCPADGRTDYEMNAKLPDPLTLSWWTFPRCDPLPPGKYFIRTTWIIKGEGMLPDKRVSNISNIFEVRKKS